MRDWSNITIEEYQHIYGIIVDENIADEDRDFKLVCLMNKLEEDYVNGLSISEYRKLRTNINFLTEGKMVGKVKEFLEVGGKEYLVNLDVSAYHLGRYVDLTTFLSTEHALVSNLHNIMASLCTRVKKDFWGRKKPIGKYGDDYDELSNAFLKMNFADCYHTAVFFWKVIRDLTKATALSSVKEILKSKAMTKQEIRRAFKVLKADGDGFIMQNF
jgi:hypothetical protein